MDKFRDIFESEFTLYEEKKDKNILATLEFSFGASDVENKNHRTYPHAVLAPAVEALGKRLESAKVPGQADHPQQGGTRLSDVSHILDKVWMDENKVAWAQASILDTTKGRDTLKVISSNVKIGASLRGFGEIRGGKVQPGLEVKTVDLVIDPSFENARIDQSNVIESYIPDEEGSAEDQAAYVSALVGLSEATLDLVKKQLTEKGANYTMQELKAFPIYAKQLESNRKLPPFHIWFKEMCRAFNPGTEFGITEEEQRNRSHMREASEAGYVGKRADLRGLGKKDVFEELIEEGKINKTPDQKVQYSKFYSEARRAGYLGSFKEWLLEIGKKI